MIYKKLQNRLQLLLIFISIGACCLQNSLCAIESNSLRYPSTSIHSNATTTSTSTQVQANVFPLNANATILSSWPTGYEVVVTLNNPTNTPTTSWVAEFDLPQNQTLGSAWNGQYSATGSHIKVLNPSWGGVIVKGQPTTFGFIVNNPSNTSPAILNLQATANTSSINPNNQPPAAPVLSPIDPTQGSTGNYLISWNTVPSATGYILEQDTTPQFSNPVTVFSGNAVQTQIQSQPNGTYFYRVYALNQYGRSGSSNTQSVTVNTQPSHQYTQDVQDTQDGGALFSFKPNWTPQFVKINYMVNGGSTLTVNMTNNNGIWQTKVMGLNNGDALSYFYSYEDNSNTINSSNYQHTYQSGITPPPPPGSPIVEGYWETWNSRDPINILVNMHVDVLDIAFANFKTTGTHTYEVAGLDADLPTITQFVTAAHQAGKKVKISIGGATYPLAPQLKTTADAVGMAQAVARFVQQNALDGVDFDIEDHPSADLQVALIQNTRQLLGNNALISYTPATPASTSHPFDQVIKAAYPYLTDISFMAYDYESGYTYQQDVQGLKNMGVPPSKLIIGLMPGYDDLNVMTSVNDITAAAQYVEQNGLGGIMFWDLNRDHGNETGLGVDAATNAAWNVFH